MALGNSGLPTSAITTDTSKTPRATMGGGGAAPTINGSSGVARPASVVKPSQAASANQTDTGGATGTRANPGTTPASMSNATVRQQSQMANPGNGTKDEEYVMPGTNPARDNTGGPTQAKLDEIQRRLNPGPGGGGTGGGSSPSGGSSTPVDTTESTGPDYAQAAGTVNRITQGVDMSEQIRQANDAWQNATQNYGDTANGIVNQYQQNTNQSLNEYQQNAQAIIDQLSGITGQQLADYANSTGQTIQQATDQINSILQGLQDSLKPVEAGRVGRVDTTEQQNILQQMTDNQRQQANQQIDYAVNQGVNDLQRVLEDAAHPFQTQRNQIAANEAQAKDNQALYAEMRGDHGGIGQAQYDAIQNTAATNQLKVSQEQTKLSTDTARQIADLRAKGEFDKADKALEITQEMLKGLMQLKQWADKTNLSVDEFNIATEKWEQETNARLQQALGDAAIDAAKYEADLNLDKQQYLTNQGLNAAQTNAQQNLALQGNVQQQRQALNDALAQHGLSNAQYMTNSDINRLTTALNAYMQNAQNMASTELSAANVFGAASDATPTFAAAEAVREQQAAVAQQMIASGITPTDDQLKALGWTKSQYGAYKSAVAAAQAAASRGGGRAASSKFLQEIQNMIAGGAPIKDINEQIANFNSSGMMSQSEYNQATKLAGNLKEGQNYFVSPANG